MVDGAAVLACLVLAALAGFQLLLVFGAPLGRFAWGGRHEVLPYRLRIGSVVSIVLYTLIAAVVLRRTGLIKAGIPANVSRTAIWVIVAYFAIGVGLNLASRSRLERIVMSPVAAVLFALCAVVALS